MTREEAIEQLNFMRENMPKEPPTECDYTKEWLDTDKDIRNSLDMAIKALEQEPCEYNRGYRDGYDKGNMNGYELRKAEEKPCNDAVSREAVKELFQEACEMEMYDFLGIDDLPPVTPTRKKGKWERGYSFPDGEYVKCTVCGEIIKCIYPMHFCTKCGADMRGGEEC